MSGVRLDPKLEKELNAYAKKNKQSKSSCVKEAIQEFLIRKQNERWHDEQTEQGLRELDAGKTIPLKEVLRYLNTWTNT